MSLEYCFTWFVKWITRGEMAKSRSPICAARSGSMRRATA